MKPYNFELKKANDLFKNKNYSAALDAYKKLLVSKPHLAGLVNFNIKLTESRLQNTEIEKNGDLFKWSVTNPKKSKLGIYDIKETNGLKKETNEGWLSFNDDPYFTLDPNQLFKNHGAWYLLEILIQGPRSNQVSRIYIDSGNGFNEDETVNLYSKKNVLLNQVVYLETIPEAVRFDPIDHSGPFAIHEFHIHQLTAVEAQQKMIECLVEKKELPYTQDRPEAVIDIIAEKAQHSKQGPLQLLYDLYNKSLAPQSSRVEYEEWIEAVEAPSLPSPACFQQTLARMQKKPLISVILPVYNTPEIYLRACIESVLAQSYPHWELCIADDCSSATHISPVLKEYAEKDSRIRCTKRPTNGHISLASNSALELAKGDFVALLDHDDLLAKHALYFIAETINAHPWAKVIYSDEDKVDKQGNRSDPHFKSDWNPDLFFSQNYISHLGVYCRNMLDIIGGFRKGVEGSQDHDLLLRCLPHIEDNHIIHIPRILYHWRVLEGSTAFASSEKSYTSAASIKALKDYFADNGPPGVKVEAGIVANTYRVRWPITEPAPLVSLLIPTRDKKIITEVAVSSILRKTNYTNYEILILDNGSVEPETLEWFSKIQSEDNRVRVLRYDHPFNYSAINNFGVFHAAGSIIGLVNNDVEVISADWLSEMVSHAIRPKIGCVGAKLYYSDRRIQHAGVICSLGGVAGHSHKYFQGDHPGYYHRLLLTQAISAVTGACLLVRKSIWNETGGLDENNLPVAFNDVDFCLKVREIGYRNLWTPFAELFHHESISRGNEDTPEKQQRFRGEIDYMKNRWGEELKNDPYYNINLTKDREDFSISI